MRIILTIAGSDSSGGAGIQADLKTIAAHGCYGTSCITALTAQNTRGVAAVHVPPAEFLAAQLCETISDFAPAAVKIGMLPNADCVEVVAAALQSLSCPVVLDPVMVATSGARLAEAETLRRLFPFATLITPNLREMETLCGYTIFNEEDMLRAASELGYPVLLKGGHAGSDEAADLLFYDNTATWLRAPRVLTDDTHGTGCTLSSAIACNLALGHDLLESCRLAKLWLTDLLREKPNFGVPNGPLFHNHPALRAPLHAHPKNASISGDPSGGELEDA
ncbi:MAG: bifunctional hydroxymethylpyrimidine kinase/phosphomethylpyrimidine kinase [Oscillospiraceae bacterium]|nr:bifunctional hydroxymethylpyrimidine kinase/phosphomethylpyrimidine kinase [Oscillospiraceae bacterium]